jgi:hypothetical protein
VPGEPGQGALHEGGDGGGRLVVEQLAIGQAAVIVDHGVEVIVAKRVALVGRGRGAIAGDRVPGPGKPRIALDIHMQQVAGARPFVATKRSARWLRRAR